MQIKLLRLRQSYDEDLYAPLQSLDFIINGVCANEAHLSRCWSQIQRDVFRFRVPCGEHQARAWLAPHSRPRMLLLGQRRRRDRSSSIVSGKITLRRKRSLQMARLPRERLILIQYFLRVLRRRALESVADGGMYGDMQLFGSLQLTDPQYCPASNCKDSENRGR